MKYCFVIMPYGGSDESLRKHYLGVYEGIIKPAAQALGFEVKRSDIAGTPGDITKDIIQDLSLADIVIADLSTANPNVFFELGIRHVLRKSGTIHIINKDHPISFDIRQYRVIQYTTDLSELSSCINEIKTAIEKRLGQPDRSDNPVHDTLPQLPVNLALEGTEGRIGQVRELQLRIDSLIDENDTLTEQITQLQSNPRAQQEQDIDALFDEADYVLETTGENILLRLTSALQSGGKEAFVKELREAVKSPYLDENDFTAIGKLCTELDIHPHQIALYKESLRRFPESRHLFLYYVSALMASPFREHKLEAVRRCEERFGVRHEGEGIVVEKPEAVVSIDEVFALFDYYLANEKASWCLALVDAIEPVVGETALLLRLKARALGKMRRYDEAENVFTKALTQLSDDDTLVAFYSDFLDDLGRYEDAYIQMERALTLDPADGSRFVSLAIQILNRGLYRNASGEIQHVESRKSRLRAALPFLIGSVFKATYNRNVRRAISILVREHMVEEAEALMNGVIPEGDYDYNTYQYIFGDAINASGRLPSDTLEV